MSKEFIVDFVVLVDGKQESACFGARARDEESAKHQAVRSLANAYYRTIVDRKYCQRRCDGAMAIISTKITRCGE